MKTVETAISNGQRPSQTRTDGAPPPAADLSVVIITLNEEKNLPHCLASLPDGVDVIILDSGSSDSTLEIAARFGARIQHRDFDDYASQKNAAIDMAKGRWILSIDADEVLNPLCREAIQRVVGQSVRESAFRIRRRLHFMGKAMRFGKVTDKPLRLFLRERGRFTSGIHEHVVIDRGPIGILPGEVAHYSYANLSDYFDRFNIYTSRIAENHYRRGKKIFLPAYVVRPWLEFFRRYFLRLGFLDGYPGYCYAVLSSFYAFVKYAKLRELQVEQTEAGCEEGLNP